MQRFKDILCVVDDEKTGKHVMERAVKLAESNHVSLSMVNY